jgi:hypothetical protein
MPHPDLKLPDPRTGRNKVLLLKAPNLWYSVTEAQQTRALTTEKCGEKPISSRRSLAQWEYGPFIAQSFAPRKNLHCRKVCTEGKVDHKLQHEKRFPQSCGVAPVGHCGGSKAHGPLGVRFWWVPGEHPEDAQESVEGVYGVLTAWGTTCWSSRSVLWLFYTRGRG